MEAKFLAELNQPLLVCTSPCQEAGECSAGVSHYWLVNNVGIASLLEPLLALRLCFISGPIIIEEFYIRYMKYYRKFSE